MQKQPNVSPGQNQEWIPLSSALGLMLTRKRLFGWSLLLIILTLLLTWLGYHLSIDFIDGLTTGFASTAPARDSILGWVKYSGWSVMSWLFKIVTRIVAFYLAFLLAYTLTTPGYVFLSTAAEKLHAGEYFEGDATLSMGHFLLDILEGIKIALLGVAVTVVAFFVNFIPGIGQIAVLLLYTYYSALMFIDYPASRRHWSLGKKIDWIRTYPSTAFRLGVLPAIFSIIPILNIFIIALLFPLLTIYATLNFSAIELWRKNHSTDS